MDLRISYYDINLSDGEDSEVDSYDKDLLMTVLVLRYPILGGDHIVELRPNR